MPHVVIEYSENIRDAVKIAGITSRTHEILIETGLFATQDIKTRSYCVQDYLVGDQGADGSFVHIDVAILEGRPIEKKQALTDQLRDMLMERLEEKVQVSVNLSDLQRDVYRKRVAKV